MAAALLAATIATPAAAALECRSSDKHTWAITKKSAVLTQEVGDGSLWSTTLSCAVPDENGRVIACARPAASGDKIFGMSAFLVVTFLLDQKQAVFGVMTGNEKRHRHNSRYAAAVVRG